MNKTSRKNGSRIPANVSEAMKMLAPYCRSRIVMTRENGKWRVTISTICDTSCVVFIAESDKLTEAIFKVVMQAKEGR